MRLRAVIWPIRTGCAIGAALAALTADPLPAEGFHAGEYHRLRVGADRVVYVVEGDLITVSRVDRVSV